MKFPSTVGDWLLFSFACLVGSALFWTWHDSVLPDQRFKQGLILFWVFFAALCIILCIDEKPKKG